ncbi:hypothetical protein [Saccharicrinis fermentans]|nr:hypothetical protein [Saccharicrinis fermentans]
MGIGTLGLCSVETLMGNTLNNMQNTQKLFPPEELKTSLEDYFGKYFRGGLFDPNVPLPDGKILIADSFEIETVTEKNNIFDIADIVIEHCDAIGFDASALKDGVIPKGMEINKRGVVIRQPEMHQYLKIDELVAYDAIVKYNNGFSIKSLLPPKDWKTIKNIKETMSLPKGKIYEDKKNELTILKGDFNYDSKISVQSIKPNLTFPPDQYIRIAISKDIVMDYFNEETKKVINQIKTI